MSELDDYITLQRFEEKYGISREWVYSRIREAKLQLVYLDGSIPMISKKLLSSLISPFRRHKRGGFRGRKKKDDK